ncbi:MAG: transcriptional regulator [Flavobacterium sp.]
MNILTELIFQGTNKPKYIQIADCIIDNISRGKLKNNQKIPSINDKRAIKVIKGVGTYIDSTKIRTKINVLFLINKLSSYKLEMYNSFCEIVGGNFHTDFEIYNCEEFLFISLLERNASQYDYYVIMPHFKINKELQNNFSIESLEMIKDIPSEKLIIMDNNELKIDGNIIEIFQDFEQDAYDALNEGVEKIKKYDTIKLAIPEDYNYSYLNKIKKGFTKFCIENRMDYMVLNKISNINTINKGDLFLVVGDDDLVKLVDSATAKNYRLGVDIGVISYDETPLKRLLGIAVISTDFKNIGAQAADMIVKNLKGKIKNPFNFIDRESL